MPRHSVRVRLSDQAYEIWRRLPRYEKVRIVWILEYILDHKARTGVEPVVLDWDKYRMFMDVVEMCTRRSEQVGGGGGARG
jgi:hypothetical protein